MQFDGSLDLWLQETVAWSNVVSWQRTEQFSNIWGGKDSTREQIKGWRAGQCSALSIILSEKNTNSVYLLFPPPLCLFPHILYFFMEMFTLNWHQFRTCHGLVKSLYSSVQFWVLQLGSVFLFCPVPFYFSNQREEVHVHVRKIAGDVTSLSWPGNTSASSWRSWRRWRGRGRSGPRRLGCCSWDPNPDEAKLTDSNTLILTGTGERS